MQQMPKTIGRYEILDLVGRGGMGVLYRARDAVLERDVALKMMLLDFTMDQTARDRFQREARAVARLQHRNVVTIHELGEVDNTPYIVMEFLSGRDLDALLKTDAKLTLAQKLDVVIQLCDGLGYAHEQGIVHRDVKPGNVRVLEDGTVKILDFGIAKFAQSSVTMSGTIMGTPSYMSPEQIMGKPVDGRADLFSVGVLLYELLAGHKPFTGESPTTVVYQIMHVEPAPVNAAVPELPESLQEIVARALQKDPDQRYGRASEMSSDLQMVKMMLDLPLKSGDDTGPQATMGALHATTLGSKTAASAAVTTMLDAPMRASAAARAADAAPAGAAHAGKGGSGMIIGIAAAVVVVGGAVAYFATRGSSDTPAPGAGAPAGASASATPGTSAPAGAGEFHIESMPLGAKILLNGSDTGKVTPATVSFAGKSTRSVELQLKGYASITAPVTDADLKAGGKVYTFERPASNVRLTLNGSYPFEVLQGGKVISGSNTHHDVTVQPDGGAVTARSAEMLLSSTVSVDYHRGAQEWTAPGTGTIAIFAQLETCKLSIDGQDLGFPPIPPKTVASGQHKVALKCPDDSKKDDAKTATVSVGQRTEVKFIAGGQE
jgi:serine/threonine-protein kinase